MPELREGVVSSPWRDGEEGWANSLLGEASTEGDAGGWVTAVVPCAVFTTEASGWNLKKCTHVSWVGNAGTPQPIWGRHPEGFQSQSPIVEHTGMDQKISLTLASSKRMFCWGWGFL